MISLPSLAGRWFPLCDRAIFRVTGPDRVRYLNGQVSNDVAGPLDREAVAACLCNLKGKVEALVHISADGDSLILDGELPQREAIHARLERYLIADDCEIIDETGKLRLIHHFIEGGGGVKSRRFDGAGCDLILRPGEPDPFEEVLRIDDNEVSLHQLVAKIPVSGNEITGAEFPAELGLDEFAVSFHKGCYLGQEIISRIRSVGRVKRRLMLIGTEMALGQGASVVNIFGERGVTTRKTRPVGKKNHLGLAIFKTDSQGGQLHATQSVVSAREVIEGPP